MTNQPPRESLKSFAQKVQGVPFAEGGQDLSGWSCWGMIRAAFRECFGVDLPDLQGCRYRNRREAQEAFDSLAVAYREVDRGREQAGDVLLLKGGPCHVALVVKPGLMLHVDKGCATCTESYLNWPWKSRVLGIYRHEQFAS